MSKPDSSSRASSKVDVPADNPEGTMERFNDGLRRVLASPKLMPKVTRRKRKKR
jgi:hypothetical protein